MGTRAGLPKVFAARTLLSILMLSSCGTSGASEPYTGYVNFGFTGIYSGQAGFYPTTSRGSCPGGAMQAGCCYESATAGALLGQTMPTADVSAGAITLNDGTASLGSLPFTAGKGYAFIDSVTNPSVIWGAGDTLGVTALGDPHGVGSFSGTVIVPALLTGMSPDLETISSLSRTSAFTLTWATNSADAVSLVIPAAGGTISCSATGSSGTLTVPTALLANLVAGEELTVLLTVSNNVALSAANASIALTADAILVGYVTAQ